MYLVNPESLISYILFPFRFSASVKDTIYLLSTRRNLARKAGYVFFITNCRIFYLLVCRGRGIGSQRRLWVLSLPFTLLAVCFWTFHASWPRSLQGFAYFCLSSHCRKTASQMHVSTASFAGVLGFWTHVLTLSWLMSHHWASLLPSKNSLNQIKEANDIPCAWVKQDV